MTDASNTPIAFGTAPITVTISTTGVYKVHFAVNNTCGTENVCRTTVVQPVLSCSNSQYPSTTTTISSTAPTTITTCNFAGEYSVDSFTATGAYTITATGGSTNYITFTDNNNAILYQGYSPLSVTVTSTGLYRIHINTNNTCGTESVCRTTVVTPLLPPSNDDCTNAIPLTVPGTYTGTTIGATSEPTTVPTCTNTGLTQPGVWYSVVGNGSTFKASLCGTTGWDSKIFVYAGNNCSSLTSVGCNDDNGPDCSGTPASIAWCTTPGTTYYILVTGYSSPNNFTLSISSFTPTLSYSVSPSTLCAGSSATITSVVTPTDNSTWSFTITAPSGATYTNNPAVITPTNTANYTLTAINNKYFGTCALTTLTFNIIVSNGPTVSISPSNTNICSGQSGVLSATGATSYTWNTGANTSTVLVNPTTTTVYTVTGSDMYGCTASANATINVLSGPSLSVNVTDATAPGCNNGSATLNVVGMPPYNYTWMPNVSSSNVATNLNGTSGSGTTYTVVVTDANGCFSSITFSVDCITGISSLSDNNNGVIIIPNPNNGIFNIQHELKGKVMFEIFDISGRKMQEFISESSNVPVNISELSRGMYIIRIHNESVNVEVPVIKE